MERHIPDPLAVFNQLYKQMDEIYHQYAKRHGVSDTVLWLMYFLYEAETPYTQRELCSAWHYPPQTINSALKSMEKQGFITLEPIPGNQKNKQIVLTEKGKETTKKIVAPLILAEQRAFCNLRQEEREALLSLTSKYVKHLQIEIK